MNTARRHNLIRVVVADDSQVTQELLREIIDAESDMIVVGTATTGRDTVAQVAKLRPDLVTMDVVMPDGDGISATKQIMSQCATPIAVVTATPADRFSNVSFEALAAGAVEVFAKPQRRTLSDAAERATFVRNLRNVAQVGVVSIRGPVRRSERVTAPGLDGRAEPVPAVRKSLPETAALIAIGASTGGPPCIRTVLSSLDPSTAPPVLIVQHMGREFVPGFATWLSETVPVSVQIATDGLRISPGQVYVAPGDLHLTVDGRGKLHTYAGASHLHQRPSVDVLFHSVAKELGDRAVGVLLTGMGEDGAAGLLAMRTSGAVTIAQDEESCLVFGMPKAAIQRDAAWIIGNPLGIAWQLRHVRARQLSPLPRPLS